jgi:2-polyprenyl-3-methyl-5-hydroxy-6-metoxy-1,4-benzoquinol methylase
MPFEPEAIPFPFSRLYRLFVARSPFFQDVYAEAAARVVARLASGSVLDIGCGPGSLALRLAESAPGLKVCGIDIARDMVRLAARQAKASPHAARLCFERADAADLPFEGASFEAVVSTIAFHHWRHPRRSLVQVHRVLKPGGFALLCDFNRDMTSEDISAAARRHGLLMHGLRLARRVEPFYSPARLAELLRGSPFARCPGAPPSLGCWSLEASGVLLWARLEKDGGPEDPKARPLRRVGGASWFFLPRPPVL